MIDNKIQQECRREAYEAVDLSEKEAKVLTAWAGRPEVALCCWDVMAATGLDQLSCRPRMTALAKPGRGLLIAVRKGIYSGKERKVTFYVRGEGHHDAV